jgi:Lrp/AsnC family leucine-responsive transcriptional regulator
MSLAELADHVGLSATPCRRRLKSLEDCGLISNYTARIDRKAAGFGITVFISVELERQEGDQIAQFQKSVSEFEEIVTGSLMTGSQDFLLEVVVESLEDYEIFLQQKLLKVAGVRIVRSRFALRKFISRDRIP